jgi:cell division protein FtsB
MLLKLFKYRYILLFAFFGLWMLFFDSNNVFYRFSIASEVSELEESRDIYKKQIAELNRQRTELFGNQINLEKFAREKYMMKKDNEDLFVVIQDTIDKNDQ